MVKGVEFVYLLGVVIDSKRSVPKHITYKAKRIEVYHTKILGYCLYDYKEKYTKYITKKAFVDFIKAKNEYITPLGGDSYFDKYLNNWKRLSTIDSIYVGKLETDGFSKNCFYYNYNGKIALLEGFDGLLFDINSGYIDVGVENVVLSLDNMSYIELDVRSMKTKDCISFSVFDKHLVAKDKNVMEMYDDYIVFCKDLGYDLIGLKSLFVTDGVVGKYFVVSRGGIIETLHDVESKIIDLVDVDGLGFKIFMDENVNAFSIRTCCGIAELYIGMKTKAKCHKSLYDTIYNFLLRHITLDVDMKQESEAVIKEYFKIKDDIDNLYRSGQYEDIFKYKIDGYTFHRSLSRAITSDDTLMKSLTALAKSNDLPYCWGIEVEYSWY